MKCKDCKHWVESEQHPGEWGECHRAHSAGGDAMDTESLAVASAEPIYAAWLNTHAHFGCIQFEAIAP